MGCWDWDVDTLVGGERVERDLRWVGTLERERERDLEARRGGLREGKKGVADQVGCISNTLRMYVYMYV